MGLIQGFTEFLPVSSSGHLVLFSRITGAESSLAFDLILHLGTLIAVVIVFKKELIELVKKPLCPLAKKLALATVFSVVVVFVLKDLADECFDGKSLPLFFMLTALLLTLSGAFSQKNGGEISYLDASIIGIAQGLAVFPGLSRSGTTASTASLLGVKKSDGVSFCFLLSIPIILGSSVVEIAGGELNAVSLGCVIAGFISALVSGLIALVTAKKFLSNGKNAPFVVYLIALSLVITVNDLFLKAF